MNDVNKSLRIFFIMLGIGFDVSSFKITVCDIKDVSVMNSFFLTIFYNFIQGIYFALPYMLGTELYQYLKNKKNKQ